MSEEQPKLIRVGGPLHRVTLKMKPCQPVEGPITDGPLITRGGPLQRVTLTMKPVSTPTLQLTFGVDPDLGLTPETVMAKVVPILELVKGCGFTWDRANSNGEPGRIVIQLVPATADAVSRLPWLKEKLTPVLADIREVKSPVMSEVPVSKV